MGVDLRGDICADGLASDSGVVDENLVARVLDAVRATRPLVNSTGNPSSESSEVKYESGRSRGAPARRVPESEIAALRKLSEADQPQAARRVAELLELNGEDVEARQWWYRAADMGDADAKAYVKHCLHDQ